VPTSASPHPLAPEPTPGLPGCRLCGAPLRDTFVDLGMSPLCESYVPADRLDAMEPFYPLHVRVCSECLLVQLPAYVAAGDIFSEYAYFSSYSTSWVRHAEAFVEEAVERFGLGPEHLVVEVASNDGYLLQHVVARGLRALGVEPAANVAEAARGRGVETEVAFFGRDVAARLVAQGRRADLLVANNVMAHVPDLHDFVGGLADLLAPDGVLSVEVQHLARLIQGHQFDTIYHEHFSYFSFLTGRAALAAHGLEVFDVQELPTHGGSLRYLAQRADTGRRPVSDAVAALDAHERALGLDTLAGHAGFADRVMHTKHALLEFLLGARRDGRSVAGYGAPGKGNTLLNACGIRADLLPFTVDRNPYKQGMFLPGTHIPIHAPEALDAARPDYVLLLPWNLEQELRQQLSHVRAWGARFVVPIPEVRIL
jgi:SAM-dependent methyltransferase